MHVGVLAVQGDFEKHIKAVRKCQPKAQITEVRTPEQMDGLTHLIIPGGESTTVGLLLERYGLGEAIQNAAKAGLPIWGTCMGMIMMASSVAGRDQYSLNLLDITVERNAFGAQVHSFEEEMQITGLHEPLMAVFIRAPIVTEVGEEVEVLATINDKVVAVRQGNRLGTSFHPELTDDTRLHEWFLSWS
ncbi:MAG: pyridoxal 5'-phosphate synthase glutaminase subunit PdxT [Armatimonadetes bacterium]|nr:pyridoxal 5'-phosphate synthase glutaminase subunit PdxT [Armatimonadota bacterium]